MCDHRNPERGPVFQLGTYRKMMMMLTKELLTQKLEVFKNKELRKIFGVRRIEVANDWRKLHNKVFT
jgi:hypothetical protein